MKMFLTRMGEGTRMVVTGDLTQIDLPPGTRSGLRDALETLEGVPGISVVRFDKRDVVRHPLVARIVDAYDQREAARQEQRPRPRGERGEQPGQWAVAAARRSDAGPHHDGPQIIVADHRWRRRCRGPRAIARRAARAAGGAGAVVLASDRDGAAAESCATAAATSRPTC